MRGNELTNAAERVCHGTRKLSNVTLISAERTSLSKICYKKVNGDKHKCRTQKDTNAHAQKRKHRDTQTDRHTHTGTHAHTHTHTHTDTYRHTRARSRACRHVQRQSACTFFMARIVSETSPNTHSGLITQVMLSLFRCRLNNAATLTAKLSDAFNAWLAS